ncbi:MAG: alpha/beta hydrolase-fold protein [Imperialibacter sp.]|uniref:alpha/beta hydrolase-fold protein n=1 Tax=Imperialibacter sp. TaxID=2038411 RepID=UPI0032EDEDF8
MKLKCTFCLAALLSSYGVAHAQSNNNELAAKEYAPLTFAQQYVLHSNILNEDRRVNIFLPESFYEVSAQHTYPVLLLLEDEFFLMVSGVVKHLSAVERMPETIVVSLADGPHIPKFYTNGSDFWPKDWKQLPFGENPDSFTAYLRQELLPYLKSNFRANDFNLIMGLSVTSMYALHTFAKEPDLFDAHIAIAAGDVLGMGYNDGESLIDVIVDDFQNAPNRKGYLYVTSADSDGNGDSPMIKANLEELERRLSPYRTAHFQFVSKSFENEGHYDVALPALEEALGMIYPKDKWFAKYHEMIEAPGNAMANIDDYFQRLSSEYGFEILPKAERWNSGNSLSRVGPRLLRDGRVQESIEVIERWVEYRPKSAEALSELAKAYEANNQLDKAISALDKALKLSVASEMEESSEYEAQLDQLKEKIRDKKDQR